MLLEFPRFTKVFSSNMRNWSGFFPESCWFLKKCLVVRDSGDREPRGHGSTSVIRGGVPAAAAHGRKSVRVCVSKGVLAFLLLLLRKSWLDCLVGLFGYPSFFLEKNVGVKYRREVIKRAAAVLLYGREAHGSKNRGLTCHQP